MTACAIRLASWRGLAQSRLEVLRYFSSAYKVCDDTQVRDKYDNYSMTLIQRDYTNELEVAGCSIRGTGPEFLRWINLSIEGTLALLF